MVKEVSEDYWDTYVSVSNKSLFFETKFLKAIADSFGYELHFFLFEEKKKILMAAALYAYKGDIVTALPYTYSSIFFETSMSDRKYILVAESFINHLKNGWKKISLRLPVEITDVRPFLWKGFDVLNRYTYLKETNTCFNKKVEKKSKNAFAAGMSLLVVKPDSSDINNSISNLRQQGFDSKKVNGNRKALMALNFQNKLLAFKAYLNGECVCNSLMLLDDKEEKSYALLISDSSNELAHVFINVERRNWCLKNNIHTIDFCGANEPGLAYFKSSFDGRLFPYFIVSYNPFLSILNNQFFKIKNTLRKYI